MGGTSLRLVGSVRKLPSRTLCVAIEARSPDSSPRPFAISRGRAHAQLVPRARYSTRAWVVAVDRDFDDPFAEVMPLDVSLAWGPVGDPAVLGVMSFHLARRYVSVRWSGAMPLDQRTIMQHLANHHIIPARDDLAEYLKHVRTGDLLALEGTLVDVEVEGRQQKTSLSRDDIGNGACEIMLVDRADITR